MGILDPAEGFSKLREGEKDSLSPGDVWIAEAILKEKTDGLAQEDAGRAGRILQVMEAARAVERSLAEYDQPTVAEKVLLLHHWIQRGELSSATLEILLQTLSQRERETWVYAEFLKMLEEIAGRPLREADHKFLDSDKVRYFGETKRFDRPGVMDVVREARAITGNKVRVHIRWMLRRDMPEVLQIEQLSFEYAWTEEDFLRCLRQRNSIGMVAERGEQVVGFMLYELHKSKLQILNFAVHPEWRRRGVGAAMVQKLISKLFSHRRTRLTLEVRETNLPAQFFFREQGFKAIRVLRAFYEDSEEDAFLMEYRFPGAEREIEEESDGGPPIEFWAGAGLEENEPARVRAEGVVRYGGVEDFLKIYREHLRRNRNLERVEAILKERGPAAQVLVVPSRRVAHQAIRVYVAAREAAQQQAWEAAVQQRLNREQDRLPEVFFLAKPLPLDGRIPSDLPAVVVRQTGANPKAEEGLRMPVVTVSTQNDIARLIPSWLYALAVNRAFEGLRIGPLIEAVPLEDGFALFV